MTNTRNTPLPRHAIDFHVGARLRALRGRARLTPEQLGEAMGHSAKAVRLWENAFNRMTAAQLWKAAEVLRVPVTAFYEGLDGPLAKPADVDMEIDIAVTARHLRALPPVHRQAVVRMARVLNEMRGEAPS